MGFAFTERKAIVSWMRNLGWAWVGLVCLGLIAAATWPAGFASQPAHASSLSASEARMSVADPAIIVMEYVEGTRADPLVQLDEFVWVKASNYYGVEVNGRRYYYRLSPHASFDPLSRGVVNLEEVRVWKVIRDAGFTVTIYTLQTPEASRA